MKKTLTSLVSIAAVLLFAGSPASGQINRVSLLTDVPLEKAIEDATQVARNDPAWQVMLADGVSMAPYYSDNSVVIVDRPSFAELQAGMIVVYRDSEGDLVGHHLVQRTEAGWVSRGSNNGSPDPHPVTAQNYVGVIFGVLNTRGFDEAGIRLAREMALPTVIGKSF